MKDFTTILLTLLFFANSIFAQDSSQSSLSLTIYNQNFGVVKDTRSFDLEKGISKLAITDVAQSIIPASVIIGFNGEVLEQNYQYDLVSVGAILKKYIDKPIQIFTDKNELIEGTLLSSQNDQLVLRKKGGGLLMISAYNNYRIATPELPAGLITRPTLLWLLNTPSQGRQNVNLTYQTMGLNWQAEYAAVLNENDDNLNIKAWVNIQKTSGTDYNDAELKLIAGNVNFKTPTNQSNLVAGVVLSEGTFSKKVAFEEKTFFEYHIYNLQNKTTLSNNENKQISLFETENIKTNKKFIYSDKNNITRTVNVILEFDNSKMNNLGIPFPQGKVRMYKSDGTSTEFIGEDNINHTPKDEKLRLNIGSAFDVIVEDKLIDEEEIDDREYEYTYEYKIINRKDSDISIDIEKDFYPNWEVLSTTHESIKHDARTLKYTIPLKKNSETILKFCVRVNY